MDRIEQQWDGGWHPSGAALLRSQEPDRRKPRRDDPRLALDEMGIKTFPLQTTTKRHHANVVDLVTADLSPRLGLTHLHRHQDGRAQANL
jgi:hypothetical protein